MATQTETQIQRVKNEMEVVKDSIIKMLHWSEMNYAEFMYETGLAYLQHYILGDEYGIAALERSRIFWSWWRNHWAQRDQRFMANISPANYATAEKFYRWWNDPKHLAGNIWPNSVILDESYAQMIGEFNTSIKQKA